MRTPVSEVLGVLRGHGYSRARTGSAEEWAELARALTARGKWRLAAAVRLLVEGVALTGRALALDPGQQRLPLLDGARDRLCAAAALVARRPLAGTHSLRHLLRANPTPYSQAEIVDAFAARDDAVFREYEDARERLLRTTCLPARFLGPG